jgi:hypothetical protein
MDICDDTEIVFHQQEMSDSFTSYRDMFMVDNPGKVIDECLLFLTFFYDGGINYKRGADSMWPLVTSVGSQLLSVIVAQNGELVSGDFHGEAFHQEGESAGERIGAATSGHLHYSFIFYADEDR